MFAREDHDADRISIAATSPTRANLLGVTGDQIWYVFEIVTTYFLVAMAGVYVGIAQAALDLTIAGLQSRRHEHTREP
jgi:alkylation response protein AidB-like acyl-CoA dehydrogenase